MSASPLSRWLKGWREGLGPAMIVGPTGSGKTWMVGEATRDGYKAVEVGPEMEKEEWMRIGGSLGKENLDGTKNLLVVDGVEHMGEGITPLVRKLSPVLPVVLLSVDTHSGPAKTLRTKADVVIQLRARPPPPSQDLFPSIFERGKGVFGGGTFRPDLVDDPFLIPHMVRTNLPSAAATLDELALASDRLSLMDALGGYGEVPRALTASSAAACSRPLFSVKFPTFPPKPKEVEGDPLYPMVSPEKGKKRKQEGEGFREVKKKRSHS